MKSDYEILAEDGLSLEDPRKRARLMQLLCCGALAMSVGESGPHQVATTTPVPDWRICFIWSDTASGS